jgi:hypothetical protein
VSGLFKYDVVVTIPSGQIWRVGSSNIRVGLYSNPNNCATVHADTQVDSALPCLNGGNYGQMTTTSLSGGTAISLNIIHMAGPCCTLTTGSYVLGRVRFSIQGSSCLVCDSIRSNSVLLDSMTAMTYSNGNDPFAGCWTITKTPCYSPTGITKENSNVPAAFKLYDNYPNPFNPGTMIRYDIPRTSWVKITIYDIPGRVVEILVNEKKPAGSYETHWDGTNYSSGVYFYKMETTGYTESKKMLMLK